jgi:hypothetical protein
MMREFYDLDAAMKARGVKEFVHGVHVDGQVVYFVTRWPHLVVTTYSAPLPVYFDEASEIDESIWKKVIRET